MRSHSSMQWAWKQCLHSGMHLIMSLPLYSDRHIEQHPVPSVCPTPGSLRLSPNTIFSKDSIVDSSRPILILVMVMSMAGASDIVLLLCSKCVKHPIPIAHNIAIPPIDNMMILETKRLPCEWASCERSENGNVPTSE
jgi:hypothetical protein